MNAPQTFVQKALARAAGKNYAAVGEILDVRPDVALSHDNTAAIARIFRTLGRERVRYPERMAITLDHAVPAPTTLHAANHAEIRRFVAEQGIEQAGGRFFEAGRGICHQVLSEEVVVRPGQVILGSDSHTTHFGWMGAFGAGIGRSEMASIWATGELWLRVPETIQVELSGELPFGTTAKDLALWILACLGAETATYQAIEFGGPGIASLSIDSRMVLPNMMAEAGAKSAYLPPDDSVFSWLARRLSEKDGSSIAIHYANLVDGALFPDANARYSARLSLDLAELEPLVACPHSPANVRPISQLPETPVQQAVLGTCTNGRLEDLAEAAAVLRGENGDVRQMAAGTRLLVIPASSQVMAEAVRQGYVDTFLQAGAMIGTPGCGPCMGNHMGVPAPGETTISAGSRNFRGRMGTADSDVYLASPAVVAASAVLGRIAAPREIRGQRPGNGYWVLDIDRPALDVFDYPTAKAPEAANTQSPISNTPPISGRVWKYGDDVNTDVIFPGKYTYTLREASEWAEHALEDLDPAFAASVRPGDIIVAGRNWGCGSSREQAVGCLKEAGIRIIIAASFARIYFRNAVNNGLLPIACPEAAAAIKSGETISVDLDRCLITCAAGRFSFPPLSNSLRAIVDAGGLIPMLQGAQS